MNAAISFDKEAVLNILAKHRSLPGAMLPILHAIQDRVGFIPSEVVPLIAEELNLSRAEVHGVVTYYHFFRQYPAGKQVVQICRAEACQSNGGNDLAKHAQKKLACDFHETTKDGQFTLEPVYCLGQCGCAPAMMVGDDIYGRVTPEKFDRVLERSLVEKRGEK